MGFIFTKFENRKPRKIPIFVRYLRPGGLYFILFDVSNFLSELFDFGIEEIEILPICMMKEIKEIQSLYQLDSECETFL